MANKYELMAGRIEAVLATQKVPARVWKATVSHRFVRFDLTIPLGQRLTKMTQLQEELAFSLGVPSVSVYRNGGVMHVEVPRDGAVKDYTLATAFQQIKSMPPYTMLLGERTDGTPLLVKLDSPDIAHLLIAGTTGSGKTVLLNSLLLTLLMTNHAGMLQVVLIDPKRRLGGLAAFPHVWRDLPVIGEPDEARLVLKALVAEMERRRRMGTALPKIVIAIDELADLLGTGGPEIAEALQRLTQAGREQGLHVVAATQRPSATLVGGMVKANFPTRLVGSVASTEDAKVAAGVGGTDAQKLGGQGDFLLIAKGQQIRFQALYVPDGQVKAICGAVWSNGRKVRAWSQFQVEQVLLNPLALPERTARRIGRTVGELVTDLVKVTGDNGARNGAGLPVDKSRRVESVSPVTVTTPYPGSAPYPPADELNETLSDAERLDNLLPFGTYLRMIEPDAQERALLRLIYKVCGTTNATMLRAYGRDKEGRIRKNSRSLDWLKTALAEGGPVAADAEETEE